MSKPDLVEVEHADDLSTQSLERVGAHALASGEAIKVRVSMQLFDRKSGKSGQYVGWRNQNWKFSVQDVEQARAAQRAIDLLFDLLAVAGVEFTARALQQVKDNVLNVQSAL